MFSGGGGPSDGALIAAVAIVWLGLILLVAAGAWLGWGALRRLTRRQSSLFARLRDGCILGAALWLLLDLGIWFGGGVTLTNQLRRTLAGAPAVHVGGRLLRFDSMRRYGSAPIPMLFSDEGYPLRADQSPPYDAETMFILMIPDRPQAIYRFPQFSIPF